MKFLQIWPKIRVLTFNLDVELIINLIIKESLFDTFLFALVKSHVTTNIWLGKNVMENRVIFKHFHLSKADARIIRKDDVIFESSHRVNNVTLGKVCFLKKKYSIFIH